MSIGSAILVGLMIATDSLLACLSVVVMRPAKMAEPIEMPFGTLSRVDRRIPHVQGQF